jgi:hypothetical protein
MGAALLLRIADPGHKRRSVSHNRRNGSEDVASVVLSFLLFQRTIIRPSRPHRHVRPRELLNAAIQPIHRDGNQSKDFYEPDAILLEQVSEKLVCYRLQVGVTPEEMISRLRHPHQRPVGAPCFESFRSRVRPTPNRIDPFIRAGLDLAQEVFHALFAQGFDPCGDGQCRNQ